MKKNLRVIQINGIRGLIMAGFVICCLIAGFVVFPGLVGMQAWNYIAKISGQIPFIGLFQGILLWGILVASYFTFRKNRLIVCMKAPQGLSDEELKKVFTDVKKLAQDDKILQAMMKARETELKIKETEAQETVQTEK